MTTSTIITCTIIVLALSAYFSGMEIAFVSSNKLRFEMERESNKGVATRILSVFYEHPNNFISTLLVGNNIALVIYGILMSQLLDIWFLGQLREHGYEILQLILETIISTLIVLVTGEFLPKTLFKINPNGVIRFFAIPTMLFYIILYPISKVASGISKLMLRCFGMKVDNANNDNSFTKVDLDHLIQSNIEDVKNEDEISDEVTLFQNALDFSNVKVRDCIVPRTEIDAIDTETTLEELKNRFVETGHSKIIIYKEDIDEILGYVHSSEMFRLKAGEAWTKSIREVPFVPETMTAHKLMKIFMQQKRSLAVVVDEFGGTSGIVTMEDLVEEIFGEIEDEHDKENYISTDLGGGEYMLSARLEIEKVNELFDLNLPESDQYLTIGGLILHEYQSFPKVNEVVKFGNWEFKIVKKTTTKIELVRLKVNKD